MSDAPYTVRVADFEVEVTPLKSGAIDPIKFACKTHGAEVFASRRPRKPGGWAFSAGCKICELADLQPILDAIQAARSNGHQNGNGNPSQTSAPGPALSNGNGKAAPREEPRSERKQIAAEAHANGNGNATPQVANGHWPARIPTLDQWRAAVLSTLEIILRDPKSEYQNKAMPAMAMLDPLIEDAKRALFVLKTPPPADLTTTDIDEECERLARFALEEWAGGIDLERNLPATQNGKLDPYENRHALDAFEVHQNQLKEKRGYSLEGLVREGGSMLITSVIGGGKTTLMLNIARGWALGGMVLGRQCQQSRTLVVVSPKEFDNWCETIGMWGLKDLIFIIESPNTHFGDPDKAAEWFKTEMQRLRCRTFELDTMFDFYGHSPNSNASEVNREVMNEQGPLLMVVRQNNWSGVVSGHAPKSEARAIQPRDPEEAFSGANAWAAQHRMRMRLSRRDKLTSIMTGRGGYGDKGILDEMLLAYDDETRLVELGGPWSQSEGAAALPIVLTALKGLDGVASMAKLVEVTGRSETFLRAGLRAGREADPPSIAKEGKGRATTHRLISQKDQGKSGNLL